MRHIKILWKKLALLLVIATMAVGASAQTSTITYFHNDISGSPMLATDANGAVVWNENYRPYGERLNNQPGSDSKNQLWFAGKPYDATTGLSYMGARYYDPVVGRFMGVDPKGFDPKNVHSFNRYAYANNNPYKFVDPDGRSSVLAITGMGILVIGGAHYALAPPSMQQEMRESIDRLSRAIGSVLHSESSGSGDGAKAEPQKAAGTGAAAAGGSPDPDDKGKRDLSREDRKAIRSYEKRIAEHEEKLAAFEKNPTVRPGMEGQSQEAIERQQLQRIQDLKTEIQGFKSNIGKIVNGG